MLSLFGIVFVFVVMIGSALLAVWIHRRQSQERNLQTPDAIKLHRGPGESLRRRMDELSDRFGESFVFGAPVPIVLLGVPYLVFYFAPNADPYLLYGSALALFAAGLFWLARRSARHLDERAKARLGYIGERLVADSLEVCLARGCRVFHDVPIAGEWGQANIDHVVVGPHGVAVVETKMRAKPRDRQAWENRVTFDGQTLVWPRCPDDSKTLWQVRKNAQWLESYLLKECGFSFEVKQVIAIPGWNVVEKVLGQPRVVNGKGAGDAVLQALGVGSEPRFTRSQVERLIAALETLCRDVEV